MCLSPSERGGRRRRGLTLLEVLISMFVLAIGLVSIGALLPVASLQMSRAQVKDRAAQVGPSAIREIKARGFLRPELWVLTNGNNVTTDSWGTISVTALTGAISFKPVAIDPLMVATGSRTPTFTVPDITGVGNNVLMQRLTLSTLGANSASAFAAATQACMSQDDLSFDVDQTNQDTLPTGGFSLSGGTPTKRRFEGRYSWMMTLSPAYGDAMFNDSRALMIMSVVVFKDRSFTNPTQGVVDSNGNYINPPAQRAVKIKFGGSTLSGGDLTLIDPTASNGNPKPGPALLNVNVGEWILLGFAITDPTSATIKFPNGRSHSVFRWYRVVSAAPAALVGTAWQRSITVAGPDFNLTAMLANNATNNSSAIIFDGAVAVYERPVHLEGPSMWTPPAN